jgi:hypothetical protein
MDSDSSANPMKTAFAEWSSRFRIRPLTIFVSLLAVVLSYESAQYVLKADGADWAYAAMAVIGAIIVVGILNNWRNGVYFFLSWLLFEDFARKFLGNNMVIYFLKDFLVLVVLISFIAAYRRKQAAGFRPPFLVPLLIFTWFGAMQIFNPASTHIVYGLMGFKLFFYYVPFLFVGYALLNSERELRRFFIVNTVLALIIVALGTTQSILGPKFLNPEIPAEDIRTLSTLYRVAPLTGAFAYRPTSVFVSAGRYQNFIMLAWLMILGFSGYLLLRRKQGRTLAFVGVAVIASGAFLTASRGVFMWSMINALITSVAFIWGAPWRQGETLRVFRTIQRASLGVVLGMVLVFIANPEAITTRLAIYEETLLPNSSASELANRGWNYPVRNFLAAFQYDRWPWGYGIGTTSLGGQYVARFFHTRPPVGGVESGWGTLVVEMGIGGLILWVVMTFSVLFSAWRVVRRLKGSPWFPVAFVIFWYAFMIFIPSTYGGMQAYEDFLLNAYLWLTLGLLFRLPTIALAAQFEATSPERSQVFSMP